MFDEIKSFVLANSAFFWGLFSLIMAIIALSQASVRFWFRDFWVRFPVVGSLATLSKDNTQDNNEWLVSETTLCSIYKPYVTFLSKDQFNERIEYMRKAGDLGRTPIPGWVIGLVALLVVAEGLGFSYILGSWMAREGSANTHTLLMFAIVFVLATIMVALTHTAGHQYYRTSMLRACIKQSKHDDCEKYLNRLVALNDPQNIDHKSSYYTQVVNRVAKKPDDKGSYAAGIIAIIAIIAIAVGSTAMRWENFQTELTHQTTGEDSAGNPFDNIKQVLPSAVTEPQKEADERAKDDSKSSKSAEGMIAFLMLGFIFVITQIVSMGAGYKYGFAGKETYKKVKDKWIWDGAYADTDGVAVYDSYCRLREPLIDLANARLKDLQQRIKANSAGRVSLGKKDFLDYLKERQGSMCNFHDVKPTEKDNDNKSPVEKAKVEIAELAEKVDQIKYFNSLPEDVKDELMPWLKQRKEDGEARKEQRNKEVEDLF